MSEELLINYTPMESRVAVLTDGVTSEILIERHQKSRTSAKSFGL